MVGWTRGVPFKTGMPVSDKMTDFGAAQVGASWPDEITERLLDLSVDLTCVASFDGYFEELSNGWIERLGYGLIGDAKVFDGIGELRIDHGPGLVIRDVDAGERII